MAALPNGSGSRAPSSHRTLNTKGLVGVGLALSSRPPDGLVVTQVPPHHALIFRRYSGAVKGLALSSCLSIRQHTSAYVSIRQHTYSGAVKGLALSSSMPPDGLVLVAAPVLQLLLLHYVY